MRNEIHFPNVWIGSRNRYEEIWLDNSTLYGGVNYIQQIADEGDDFQFGVVASAECRFVTDSLEVTQYVKRGDRFEYDVQFDNNPMVDNFARKGIFYVDSIKTQGKLTEVIGYDCVGATYRVEVNNGVKTEYLYNLDTLKMQKTYLQNRNTIYGKLTSLVLSSFGYTIDLGDVEQAAQNIYIYGNKIGDDEDRISLRQLLKESAEILGAFWVADKFTQGKIDCVYMYANKIINPIIARQRKTLIFDTEVVQQINGVALEAKPNNYWGEVSRENVYYAHAPHLLCNDNITSTDISAAISQIFDSVYAVPEYHTGKIELFEEAISEAIVQEGLHNTICQIGDCIYANYQYDNESFSMNIPMVISKIEINNAGVTYYSYGNAGKRQKKKDSDNTSTVYNATRNKHLSNDSAGVNMNGSDISKCGAIQFTENSYGYTLPSTGVEGQIFFKLI